MRAASWNKPGGRRTRCSKKFIFKRPRAAQLERAKAEDSGRPWLETKKNSYDFNLIQKNRSGLRAASFRRPGLAAQAGWLRHRLLRAGRGRELSGTTRPHQSAI